MIIEFVEPSRCPAGVITQRAGIGIHTHPVKHPTHGRELDRNTRTCNALLRGLRCLGERGFALLAGRWRALCHITTSPHKIGVSLTPGA